MILLQLALDTPEALAVLPRVASWVDIVEVGTPLLKRFGLAALATVREIAPKATLLADSKTVDGGGAESKMLFDAGADLVTVLSCARPATIEAVAREARAREKAVMVDTLTEADPVVAATRAYPDAVRYVALHTGTDARLAGAATPADLFDAARRVQTQRKIALAGGIDRENIAMAVALRPAIIIVGRAITTAADPVAAAEWMRGSLS